MIVKLIQYIRGYVRIRITGYSPERFLNLCSHHQIRLWGLKPCGHAYEMYLSIKNFRKLKPILRKSNMRIKVLERRGLPFFLNRNRKRQAFFIGVIQMCIRDRNIIFVTNELMKKPGIYNCKKTDCCLLQGKTPGKGEENENHYFTCKTNEDGK